MDIDTIRRDLDAYHGTDRFTALVIFSSDHDFPAFAKVHDIGYKAVIGLYQGLIEESFVIDHADGIFIVEAGLLKGQESVLLLSPQEALYGGQRETWLARVDESGMFLTPDPNPQFLGHWHKVNMREALLSDAWTCYPEDNTWYVTKTPDTPTCDNLSQ